MARIEVRVPDIGDFKDVEVIELLVKPGDRIEAEQSLITVESDKASMEIPSSAGGVVQALLVKLGDKVSEGTPLVQLEGEQGAAQAAEVAAPAPAAEASTPSTPAAAAAPAVVGEVDHDCDLLVLGAGPGGYSAAFRAADLGLKVVLVERYATLGGVCLNVGCIPSKALLHVAAVIDEAAHLAGAGVQFAAPSVDRQRLAAHKDQVVAKLTGGLAAMARSRKVSVVRGEGAFIDPHHVEVRLTGGSARQPTGQVQRVRFQRAIIAAGSQAVRLPFLPQDPRIVDSTGALSLQAAPRRMLVIGGGIIGLEMGTVYSTLGASLDVVEMLDGLMPGTDRDLVKVWQKFNSRRFEKVMLGTRTVEAQARDDGIWVRFEGQAAPAEAQRYDLVLQAVGRSPNGRRIGAERAGVEVDARGFIAADRQLRTNVAHIHAIGDVHGQPMLAHKAVHEGHVAAEVCAGELRGDEALARSSFDARVIPSVAYTDPEIAWVGLGEDEARSQGIEVRKAVFPWAASGRAIANGRDEGFTKLLFDASSHRIVGGGIVGTHAGDLIGEIALAIEMGADAVDIGRTVHPHPTLGESIGLAAEVAEGSCTDLPPPRGR